MKMLFIALVTLIGCSKSSQDNIDPVDTAANVSIQSAKLKDYSGVTELELTLFVKNSTYLSAAAIIVYKDGIAGEHWSYNIDVKDGYQVVVCANYSSVSPLKYQIRYTLKTGSVDFSDMKTTPFN